MAFSIYNASAGAGKTYTLTKEYLKIILKVKNIDHFKRVLAITFTNKAAEEMKNRILLNLLDFVENYSNEKTQKLIEEIAHEIHLSPSEIIEKSRILLKNIIHNYAAFDVTTIDKVTHRIIRAFSKDLNLTSNFEIEMDLNTLLQNAIEQVIEQAGKDKELTAILLKFAYSKLDEDKSWDISKSLLEISQMIMSEEHAQHFDSYKKLNTQDFIKIENEFRKRNQENLELISNKANQILNQIQSLNLTAEDFNRGTFYKHIVALSDGVLKEKKYELEEEISGKAKLASKNTIENHRSSWVLLMREINASITKCNLYKIILDNIIPISLIHEVFKVYNQTKEDLNIVPISDFNTLINQYLKDQPAPYIYERIGEKYRHYFIDEFQDTSVVQWENFIPLLDNALASQDSNGVEGTVMLVGDPKQSIYRWRGGKAEQFINLTTNSNPFPNTKKQLYNLDTNYRSYSQVIEFNNDFFKFVATYFDDESYKKLYQEKSSQKTNSKIGGYVSMQFINSSEAEFIEEDESLDVSPLDQLYLIEIKAAINQATSNGFDYGDISILVNKNKEGIWIANYLHQNDIPVISSEALLLKSSNDVQFLIHFLKYINNKNDRESLVNVLYYLSITKADEINRHLFIKAGLEICELQSLSAFLQKQGFIFDEKTSKGKSLLDIVMYLINCFLLEVQDDAYLQYFVDVVIERNLNYKTSIADFISFWEEKNLSIPSPENKNSIQILTIHKSKGLEFPVVIYPFAKNRTYAVTPKVWIDTQEEELQSTFVGYKKELEKLTENSNEVYQNKSQELIFDLVNKMYVALTRAEEQLYIITNFKKNNAFTESKILEDFLISKTLFSTNQNKYEFGNPQRISKKTENQLTATPICSAKNKLDFSSIKIAQKSALMWDNEQKSAIEFGNLVHQILAQVVNENDCDKAINKAYNEALFDNNKKTLFETMIAQIVFHEELKEYFNPENHILNEQTILVRNQINCKPDKLVFKDKQCYILDYKTGEKEKKHELQLNDYSKVIESMGYKVVKKTLVYIGEQINVIHL